LSNYDKNIYDLLGELCNLDRIKQIIRDSKDDAPPQVKKELVIGKTMPDVLKNLKSAVTNKLIDEKVVFGVLREAEENGNQHIFYFTPRTKAVQKKVQDGSRIAEILWGKKWQSTMGFPAVHLVPEESRWADFRPAGVNGKPADWLGKIYRLELHERYDKETDRGATYVTKRFEIVPERNVFVVRWNQPDLLEIRIHRAENTSRKALATRLKSIWEMLAEAFSVDEFVEVPIKETVRKMLTKFSDAPNSGLPFAPGNVALRCTDGGGVSLTSPDTEQGDLFSAIERGDAMRGALKRNATCQQSSIKWRKSAADELLDEDLRMVLGGHLTNEVIIASRISSKAIDYVTDQLRRFGR